MTSTTRNRVLRALPRGARERVLMECQKVRLEPGDVLSRAGDDLKTVHFPETAVISTLSSFADGASIEVANVGRDASTGTGLVLGSARELNTNVVQVGGEARRMEAAAFERLRGEVPEFDPVLLASVRGVFFQVMVSGACNAKHDARRRLARWLLTMHDRAPGNGLHLTQDFLAEILGVRRATVSGAAADLKAARLIDYARGRIRILDREGLRQASCECYDLVREAYETLLPFRDDGDEAGETGRSAR